MTTLAPTAKQPSDLFFASDARHIAQSLDPFLTRDPAGIVVSYLVGKTDPFGAQQWKSYVNLDVDNAKLPPDFYNWWFSSDPVDPSKLRCETHLPPVLRPDRISLQKLQQIFQNPKQGYASKYQTCTSALIQLDKRETSPACWLVMRKDVCERGGYTDPLKKFMSDLNTRTDVRYEALPSAIDLVTVIFAHRAYTGECYLGNASGMEKRRTFGICSEKVRYILDDEDEIFELVIVGDFNEHSGLRVDDLFYPLLLEEIGIAGIKKFKASE